MASQNNPQTDKDHDVIIIGAGIIGLNIADHLLADGRKVTLIDPAGVANKTSMGNAGAFAFSDIFPLASPGLLKKAPKWLLDPLGPLSIRPSYFPKLAPWLFRFWRASQPKIFEHGTRAMSALMDLSRSEVAALVARQPSMGQHIRNDGALQIYESVAELDAGKQMWAACEARGFAFEHLYGDEIADYQPGLSPTIKAATFFPQWQSADDPHLYACEIWAGAQAKGAILIKAEVQQVTPTDQGAQIHTNDGRTLEAKIVIIAAGAWSHRLTQQLGDHIPLETERGYNTTLPSSAFDLKRQIVVGGHGFFISALSTGIRVGGAVEFAGLDAKPNYKRSEHMLKKAAELLPGLQITAGEQWMGYRPSLPDSLPVIGQATSHANIHYAFGHGHLGLTQSAATGRIVADLIAKRTPPIDIQPFRPDRF